MSNSHETKCLKKEISYAFVFSNVKRYLCSKAYNVKFKHENNEWPN